MSLIYEHSSEPLHISANYSQADMLGERYKSVNFGTDRRLRVHTLVGPLREGYHEGRRCSRNTHPESYITKYTKNKRGLAKLIGPMIGAN